MTWNTTENDPLARLVTVSTCLAIAGLLLAAGLWYAGAGQPVRAAEPAPGDHYVCSQCAPDLTRCTEICKAQSCYIRCQAQYETCSGSCT